MVVSGHATTTASCQRGICVSRAESSRGADAHFRQSTRLRGIRGGDRASQSPFADAGFGVVHHAQSLAFRALAPWRWGPVGVHALVDGHAHATLARGAWHGRNRPAVPGPFQVVPDPGGRAFIGGAAVCGAKPVAGEDGRRGRCVAVVESLASSARRRGRTLGRWSAGDAATLAATRAISADRSGTGGVAAVGCAGGTVWRGVVAGTDGEATGAAIHATCSRPAVEITARGANLRLPTPSMLFCARNRGKHRTGKLRLPMAPFVCDGRTFLGVIKPPTLTSSSPGRPEVSRAGGASRRWGQTIPSAAAASGR